ncbi:MAG: phosphopantetheine-binding protein [Verrucomicrobiota bacterium]
MKESEIIEGVTREVAEALQIPQENVKLESKLGLELGAESIDYLDLTFRLEKVFGLEIPDGELFQSSSRHPSTMSVREVVDFVVSRKS